MAGDCHLHYRKVVLHLNQKLNIELDFSSQYLGLKPRLIHDKPDFYSELSSALGIWYYFYKNIIFLNISITSMCLLEET